MSTLRIFDEDTAQLLLQCDDPNEIATRLEAAGIRFEQWPIQHALAADTGTEQVLQVYRCEIDRLVASQGYLAVDVISLSPTHPDKVELRKKFLSEHRHGEDEVRFFVAGQGLFSLHLGKKIYEVLCQRGDLIGVPAGTAHWFDMGSQPDFIAIRFFNNPAGWVANYTGNAIAERFSRLG